MSPSVIGSSIITRDEGGTGRLELLVLWRGSPGWFMRQTGRGSSMSGGSAGGRSFGGRGTTNLSIREGGLNLTATFNAATRVARILDEDVPLGNANVIFVDQVDDPAGPRVLKSIAVTTPLGPADVLNGLVLATPELLDYLRCGAHVPDPQNRSPFNYVCSSAVALGRITAEHTVTPIPVGPIQNRAIDTGPSGPPPRPAGPSSGSADGVLSPVVVGGWFTTSDGAGHERLDLLVLWRGSLGWALGGQQSGGGGGGGSSGRRGMTIRRGDLSLHALLDAGGRACEIQGTPVPLGDDNVVLVDDVDSAGGPKVIKTLRIEPDLPEPRRIDAAIRRSPELVSYLRCDLKLPDARQQAMMDVLCSRYTGKQ